MPLLVSPFRRPQTRTACSEARVEFRAMLATFMILVRFLDSVAETRSRLIGTSRPSRLFRDRGCCSRRHRRRVRPRGAVRKPQPVLDQDVLDKDINALNETTDVETEN